MYISYAHCYFSIYANTNIQQFERNNTDDCYLFCIHRYKFLSISYPYNFPPTTAAPICCDLRGYFFFFFDISINDVTICSRTKIDWFPSNNYSTNIMYILHTETIVILCCRRWTPRGDGIPVAPMHCHAVRAIGVLKNRRVQWPWITGIGENRHSDKGGGTVFKLRVFFRNSSVYAGNGGSPSCHYLYRGCWRPDAAPLVRLMNKQVDQSECIMLLAVACICVGSLIITTVSVIRSTAKRIVIQYDDHFFFFLIFIFF